MINKEAVQGVPTEQFYGLGSSKHPPYLTRTERPRFIRSYYRLWGMMRLDAAEWQMRLDAMTLKQLYHLYEMSRLTQSIGGEEVIPAQDDSMSAIKMGRSEKRIDLERSTWKHIERIFQDVYGDNAIDVWGRAAFEGFMWFLIIWDHWQPELNIVVCGQPTSPGPSFEKENLWDDSSDDEDST